MRWSGNTTTRCFVQASVIACTVAASSGWRLSTPWISAPSAGCRALTVIVMPVASRTVFLPGRNDRPGACGRAIGDQSWRRHALRRPLRGLLSMRWLPVGTHRLAHMDGNADLKHLFPVDPIAKLAVELDVLGEELVGIEPDLTMAQRGGDLLGMGHQLAAETPSLEGGRHRHVLDQQMVGFCNRLDQRGQCAHPMEEIDAMGADSFGIVRRHRLGLAPDQWHPFGIGLTRELADVRNIRCHRLPQFPRLAHPRPRPSSSATFK